MDESWSKQVATRLEELCAGFIPEVRYVGIEEHLAPALHSALASHQTITISQLPCNNVDRAAALPAVVSMIVRQDQIVLCPSDDLEWEAGDALLLAVRHVSRTTLHCKHPAIPF